MQLFMRGQAFQYETENIIRLFFPEEKIDVRESGSPTGARYIVTEIFTYDDGTVELSAECYLQGYQHIERVVREDIKSSSHDAEMIIGRLLYKCLSTLTKMKMPWGVLTGVRPAKLTRKLVNDLGRIGAQDVLRKQYLVSPPKAELACEVAERENRIISSQGDRACSVYVAIPFCPTRCSYCSFVSHSIEGAKKLIPDYVEKLLEEIDETARIIDDLGLELKTIYIGGGTPTSISDEYFEKILVKLKDCFGDKNVLEFTVEAGRPDTITREKLRIMKENGVDRISVNPQTFHQNVLDNIGRSHSVEDIFSSFALAREMGFDNINMDLIAGLPGDSVEGFVESVKKAISLEPENITVHTLAMKRASNISTEHEQNTACKDTAAMLERGNELLYANDYRPYYMYRQSKSVGNLENVGWAKDGRDCLYNVFMMEETQSVFACGAGAVTKLVKDIDSDDMKLDRVFNFKYPYEYIDRFDKVLERKKNIYSFYEK